MHFNLLSFCTTAKSNLKLCEQQAFYTLFVYRNQPGMSFSAQVIGSLLFTAAFLLLYLATKSGDQADVPHSRILEGIKIHMFQNKQQQVEFVKIVVM